MFESHQFGEKAENEVWKFLKKRGYRLHYQNYRTKLGEIDLIVQKDEVIVFVEVKALSHHPNFRAEDHFDFKKRRKLTLLARAYLARMHKAMSARVDLITVMKKSGDFFIEHYENVIQDA